MDAKMILRQFERGKTFEKQQFREVVHEVEPEYTEASISWLLGKLKTEKKIRSVGKGKYVRMPDEERRTLYAYCHSQEYQDIEYKISAQYPLAEFQMWEMIQFNEFVNHQISKNLVVVEVESMLEDAVFETLHMQYPYVMFSPNMDYYYRHKGEKNTIVVLKMISEAPRPYEGHSSPLEKLLVDLFVNKFTGHLIERSEYPGILEDAFYKYCLDETKMFRYARRRNVEKRMKEFIRRETEVRLMTER